MSKEESKDVYQLFLERTGRASMVVTSNGDTAEWLGIFDDLLLAQSIVDRFKNVAYDFVIGRVIPTAAQARAGHQPPSDQPGHEAPSQPARPVGADAHRRRNSDRPRDRYEALSPAVVATRPRGRILCK
jgi:hypothetical protein